LEHAIYGIGIPDAQDPNGVEHCLAILAEMKTESVGVVWKFDDPATSFFCVKPHEVDYMSTIRFIKRGSGFIKINGKSWQK
jgi:hypothetical protein